MSTYNQTLAAVDTTTTSGGTTALTSSNNQVQYFIGINNQTVILPNATTLAVNQIYLINNASTGSLTLEYFGGASFTPFPSCGSNSQILLTLSDNSTSTGIWTASKPGGNNFLNNVAISGNLNIGGTATITGGIVSPTSGTFNGVMVGSSANTISGLSTIVNTGTLTLPTSTDTLVGRATTDTLTNKSISGSANTLTNIPNSALTNNTVIFGSTAVALGSSSASISTLTLTGITTFPNGSSIDASGDATFGGNLVAEGASGVASNTGSGGGILSMVAGSAGANNIYSKAYSGSYSPLTVNVSTLTVKTGSTPTTALTIDTSQNATFNQSVAINGNLTCNAPAGLTGLTTSNLSASAGILDTQRANLVTNSASGTINISPGSGYNQVCAFTSVVNGRPLLFLFESPQPNGVSQVYYVDGGLGGNPSANFQLLVNGVVQKTWSNPISSTSSGNNIGIPLPSSCMVTGISSPEPSSFILQAELTGAVVAGTGLDINELQMTLVGL